MGVCAVRLDLPVDGGCIGSAAALMDSGVGGIGDLGVLLSTVSTGGTLL